jgi:CubicO group peptidase (beta-lactamase class C family)
MRQKANFFINIHPKIQAILADTKQKLKTFQTNFPYFTFGIRINLQKWSFLMIFRNFLSLLLVISLFTLTLPQIGYAQSATTQTASDYSKQLAEIEAKVEKRRNELGIPGMSLVIVKDDKVIYSKGLGYKDFEKKIAVTADTQFAIGSATKAFTALSVLMSADEGKLSLDDSPKKYLPYFKMKDAETDKNMTVRDLMAHNSGLNRTDLAMITGKLNRQELIQVAGDAQPMAKFREKFFYNNIMFAAAGEITAKANNSTWEKYVPARIFAPLGMTNSNLSIKQMEKAKDYSFGYEYNFDSKETRRLPFRPIDDIGPAGSINSSANDMAKWIRFVMNRGTVDGKRLVSEKGFEEWTKPQMKITPNGKVNYGLGWFLEDRNGSKIVQHGGNIDGFNSMVAMIPEKNIGFVMLTNVSGSSLGDELMPIIFEGILGSPNPTKDVAASDLQKEVGKYSLSEMEVEVKIEGGKLFAVVPGQPTYTLENVGGRRFKLKEIDGFFVIFKDDAATFEQPNGTFDLQKIGAKIETKNSGSATELIAIYSTPDSKGTVEIKEDKGKVTFNIEGQQPYALSEKGKDEFNLSPLPPTYFLKVKRDAANKVTSVVVSQPEGEFEFKKTEGKTEDKPKISVDELMAKTIEAAGGESNWRKITSRETVADIDAIHQGVKGSATSYAKFPNKSASETVFIAVGKVIGKGWEYFDGAKGEIAYTFAPVETYAGKQLEDARLNSDFYSLLDWKTNYKTVEVKGIEKVGDEECYAVEFTPEKGTKVTDYYSTKSFLMLKRKGVSASSTSENTQPYTIVFSDYREVDGIKLPFKSINTTSSMGDIISNIKSVKHNQKIDDSVFQSKKLK